MLQPKVILLLDLHSLCWRGDGNKSEKYPFTVHNYGKTRRCIDAFGLDSLRAAGVFLLERFIKSNSQPAGERLVTAQHSEVGQSLRNYIKSTHSGHSSILGRLSD